jgi:hypothetical protein
MAVAFALSLAPESQTEQQLATDAKVKGELLSAMTGIRSANMAAMTVFELGGDRDPDREAMRETLELADDAVELAKDGARDLGGMQTLPEDLREDASTAAKTLGEADETVDRMEKALRGDPLALRKQAAQLHDQLMQAEQSMEKIATKRGIPTKLGMP